MAEINGKIEVIGSIEQVSASFKKRDLVIVTEEQYPQYILIQFTQDRCAFLDYYRLGDYIKVHINIGGRKWTNPEGEIKFFNQINGWKIERLDIPNQNQAPAPQAIPAAQPTQAFPTTTDFAEMEHDDLPF